jgi:hypothetical protein
MDRPHAIERKESKDSEEEEDVPPPDPFIYSNHPWAKLEPREMQVCPYAIRKQ